MIKKQALIDKVTLNNVRIVGFDDMERLQRKGIVDVTENPVRYITESGQEFNRLTVNDCGFAQELRAGSMLRGPRIDYCTMRICKNDAETGNLNCRTVEDLLQVLDDTQIFLNEKHGICVDFSDVGLKSIEINKTFRLNGKFEEYKRAVTLLMSNIPGMELQMDFKEVTPDGAKTDTFYAFSRKTRQSKHYRILKIYNKTKSLESIIYLSDDFMRVELTLIGSSLIKKQLGTNFLHELTDEQINKYFSKQMKKLLIEPYEKYKNEMQSRLVKMMREERKKDLKHWITNMLRDLLNAEVERDVPVILDVEEILPLVKQLGLKANRAYDVRQSFIKQALKHEKVFTNRDDLKLMELIYKLINDTDTSVINTVQGGMLEASKNAVKLIEN